MGEHAEVRRVVLVDDDAAFLEALEALLADDPAIAVVGKAHDGREALGLVAELRPDVVTMDIDMPVMDGVVATRAIAEHHPETCVVTITSSTSAERIDEARAAGASAHVMKSRIADELPAAIHAACEAGVSRRAA
ncbi:MAG: response regulator transcription factor [Actinomycetota bacterium]|nr:response regulator transcription factor [Actinomycetota bacterium]